MLVSGRISEEKLQGKLRQTSCCVCCVCFVHVKCEGGRTAYICVSRLVFLWSHSDLLHSTQQAYVSSL
jgi:hypothetical protein